MKENETMVYYSEMWNEIIMKRNILDINNDEKYY